MAKTLYSELAWLPRPAAMFSEACKAALLPEDGIGRRLRALAGQALDSNQLTKLARVIALARTKGSSLAPLVPFRLGVVSNSTTDFLVPALVATAARHGIALECIAAAYDQVIQEALAPDSTINRAKPDAVLIALDHRGLPFRPAPGDRDAADRVVDGVVAHLDAIRQGFRTNCNAISIVQTIARPPEQLFGSLDAGMAGTLDHMIQTANRRIADGVAAGKDLLVDVARVAETVGLAHWHDLTQWNLAKLPFCDAMVPLYADHVCRVIAAAKGKSRRCLVLDLDNTLWGGVIGDDGLEGIKLAQGDAVGEGFLSVQRFALALRERGVVLAVSSKNNDEVARLPFQKHPEMVLREEHLAVFQANWNDKASNILAIAEELKLGLESFVLLDDNPVERDLVRKMLPDVAVPELPEDPALYARTLAAAGYFEAVTFSDEDRKRAAFYQDNARRLALQKQAGDIDGYLASLEMEITFQPFDATGRARIAQLISKSNQFNLTTRRYTEAQVEEMARDPSRWTLQVRLADKLGDNGMICVVICRKEAAVWEVDTWLMSCRVLGRRVEQMVLREMLDHARREGAARLVGVYRPTERNKLVEKHYEQLGFVLARTEADGATVWHLDVASASVPAAPMAVRRLGFGAAETAAGLAA
ncbi:MAG TPA: HAD-IIIC family phosphatase [Methylomirabilota bacterium]|nr:HAD-IIIC family phosphatase [Methylomirabilota bacterium]